MSLIKEIRDEARNHCDSYCSHGGVCELDRGHDGLHDSRYCQWTDAEALSRDEADAVLLTSGTAGAQLTKLLWDMYIPRS